MGEYFVIPDDAFTNTMQKIAHSQWEEENNLEEKMDTVCNALTKSLSASSATPTTPAPPTWDRGGLDPSLQNKYRRTSYTCM